MGGRVRAAWLPVVISGLVLRADVDVPREDVPREVAEAALAHTVSDATERAYRRTDLFERRRKLMESWSTFLSLSRTF